MARGIYAVLSDKGLTTLKSKTFVPYAAYGVILSFSATRTQKLIGNRHTLVGYLPIRCTLELLEEYGSSKDREMWKYGFISSMAVPLEISVRAIADSM